MYLFRLYHLDLDFVYEAIAGQESARVHEWAPVVFRPHWGRTCFTLTKDRMNYQLSSNSACL